MNGAAQNTERTGAQKVSEIQSLFSLLSTRLAPMRRAMLRNYNYAVGDQISPDAQAELDRMRRPAIVMNYMHNIILSVAGYLYAERKSMKATPLRMGDEKGAAMHTVLVSDFAVGDDGFFEIAKATVDAVIAKYGVVQAFWTTRGNPEGRCVVESCDPFSILFDTDARKTPDGGPDSDWRYYQFTRWLDAEELISALPQLSAEMKAKIRERDAALQAANGGNKRGGKPVGWFSKIANGVTQWFSGSSYNTSVVGSPLVNDWTDSRNGLYRVVEHHDKRSYTKKVIYDAATRQSKEVPMDKHEDQEFIAGEMMQQQAPQLFDVPAEERWITIICPALVQDDVLVEMPYEVQDRGWQHKMITCYDWHPDITKLQSVADAMISPQDAINQREMSWLEFVLDMLNPQVKYPKGSIGVEQLPAWEQSLRGAMLEYNAGAQGQGPEKQYPNAEAARLLVQNKDDNADKMYRLTGVSPNLGGQAQTENESGVLFSQRVQAALFNLSTIVTHQGNTMRHLFRYIDALLQENLTLPRTVRLLSEPVDGMEGVQSMGEGNNVNHWLMLNWPTLQGVLNDVKQGEYDFKVDTTQLGPTAKRMQFAESVEIMNQLPEQLKPYHLFVKGWDSAHSADWAKFVEERMGIMMQGEQMQQQTQQQMQDMKLLEQEQNLQINGAERTKQLLTPRK